MNNKLLSLVCFSIFALIVLFGLWPFKLNQVNRISWLESEPGVRFGGTGHLYGAEELSGAFSGRNLSLEIMLRPASEPNNRLPVIVCLWDGRRQEVFLVGQWKDSLAIRVRTSRPDVPRGYRERGKSRVLLKDRSVLLTLTSSEAGTRLYVDGAMASEWPGFPLLEADPAGSAFLILGNSAVGQSPWEGDLLGLALYDRTLSDREVRENHARWLKRDYPSLTAGPGLIGLYPFAEGKGDRADSLKSGGPPILKPAVFQPLQKVILEWPTREQWKRWVFYQDVAVNILGFIPLGFFFTLWLLRYTPLSAARAAALTLFLGALISLGIELTQVYLPDRNSQVSDLVCNMLGTVVGVGLARWEDEMMEYWNNGIKTKKRL